MRPFAILLISTALIHAGAAAAAGPDCPREIARALEKMAGEENPFFRPEAAEGPLGVRGLQWHALNVLRGAPGISPRLRHVASEKIRWFDTPAHYEPLGALLRNENPKYGKTQAALEYCLTTFIDPGLDREFRSLVIDELANIAIRDRQGSGHGVAERLEKIASSGDLQARRALDAIRVGVPAPTLQNRLFRISPEEFSRRVAQVRTVVADSPTFRTDSVAELRDLRERFRSIRGRMPHERAESLDQEIKALLQIASADQRIFRGGRYLMLQRLPNAENLGNLRIFSEAERNAHRLEVRDGKLYGADGKLFDTHGEPFIFIMDGDGNLFAVRENLTPGNRVKHASLAGGAKPVAAAGELLVKDGEIVWLSDSSGNYRPPRIVSRQVVKRLRQAGVPLADDRVRVMAPAETEAPLTESHSD